MRKVALRALVALIYAALCDAQAPSTAQQKGSASGTVTSASGEPLKSAKLTLQGPQTYAASSDALGNFTFNDVDSGRYTLFSEKPGYLRANYNASSSGTVASLDLTTGQALTGIAIKMTPQAVISGRITDEDGEPFPNLNVQLSRWMYSGGQRRLQPSNGGSSNAEGIFSIGSLAAGSYYVAVNPPFLPPVNAIQKGPQETYVATYYPGATDPASAIAVQVATGAVMRGIEIRMRKALAFQVRGKIVDPASGAAPPNASLLLLPKDASGLPIPRSNAVVKDGAFVFGDVLPGVYILQAMPVTTSANGNRTTLSGTARQIVSVGNSDLDGLVVQLGPGAEITGTISSDGSAPPQQQQQGGTPGTNVRPRLQLIVTDGTATAFQNPQFNDDGTFAIHNIMPALYRVEMAPLPPGTYVKSIRFGSQDLMKTPLDLTGGSGGAINVVLSPNAGDISGTVHGADGMPLASAVVTLWTPGVPVAGVTDFTRTARTDANGQFKFASLPPGGYRIAAWEQIDAGLGTVPEFRMKFESKAAAVKLEENAHENIEAPLIGRDAIDTEAAKLQ